MYKDLVNVGIVENTIPAEIMDKLKEEIAIILANPSEQEPFNMRLVGHIRHEYSLHSAIKILEPFIMGLVSEHEQSSSFMKVSQVKNEGRKLGLKTLWVNLQQKGEFNPVHNHTGIYSFVIWVQIPYKIEEELAVFYTKDNRTSCFEFIYLDVLGHLSVNTIHVSKDYEGKILLFPSQLYHCVYPFYTSNDLRISISGNVDFL